MDPVQEVENLLQDQYGIGIGDCCDEDTISIWANNGESPEEIVEYLAEKYDLTPL